jgi:heme-degrading monooxygenase HmoA
MTQPAPSPPPPYWAVIFTNQRRDGDDAEYGRAAERMQELAARVPGFLGIESVRAGDGLGITVSYWDSEQAIAEWRLHPEHLEVQARGREDWYSRYELRVARVERTASFGA